MIVQLLQVRTLPVTAASTTSGVTWGEGSTRVCEECIARGVLQPDALLGGVTREWSGRLILVQEVALFDAKGVRLGLHDGVTGTDEVCNHHMPYAHSACVHGHHASHDMHSEPCHITCIQLTSALA